MKVRQTIRSAADVYVAPYAPGVAVEIEPDRRPEPLLESLVGERLTVNEIVDRANRVLACLGLSHQQNDLLESLRVFSGESNPAAALARSVELILLERAPLRPADQIRSLFERTGILGGSDNAPTRLYCHVPGTATELDEREATHYGYVLDGEGNRCEWNGRTYPLYPRSYFAFPGPVRISGPGRILAVTQHRHRGLPVVGGEVADWGLFRYIDGCTDTVLISPPRKGDPCLNALYFPPSTVQTQHYHPSLRAGVIFAGAGTCRTPQFDAPLLPGTVFVLPPRTWHAFETDPGPDRVGLGLVAFHPDSDFGPTDEDHPMLNRTYITFLQRLRSAARLG